MNGLYANTGGCIGVYLEQNMKYIGYNERPYNFTNVNLTECKSKLDGGAINV